MAEDPTPEPGESSNVILFEKASLRKRVSDAVSAALAQWPAIVTDEAKRQMIDIDVNSSQILFGMRRAEILNIAEDPSYGRMSFTAKLLSAGEEFFVAASVERVVPFSGTHVVINRVWR